MANMYGGTILLVNLSEGKVSKEPTTSYSGAFLGGRGINIKLLYDGVPPEVGPLDPASLLIFGVGPLCGTPVPASRTEVTAKSPEGGFLGSSSFGGFFSPELKFAGYDNIVITGKADKPVYIWIYNERVEIRDASNIWGKDTYETQEIIRSEVDPEAKIVCIGQAGENLVHFASVQSELGHGGGRTGMGGVMGSKNLKAIVVRGTKGITLANPERYLSLAEELQQEMEKNPSFQDRKQHGMAHRYDAILKHAAAAQGQPKPASSYDAVLKYKPKKTGCFGCPQQCMDLYQVETKGGGAISCVFYSAAFSGVRNTDVDVMLESSLLAHRYGIDIASSMAIISWLMELYEKGVITAKDTDGIAMEWGSRQAIIGMFRKIVHREGFGDVLADGILPAAERIGRGSKNYANQVKGMAQPSSAAPPLYPLGKGAALDRVVGTRADGLRTFVVMVEGIDAYYPFLYGDKVTEYLKAFRQKMKKITGTDKSMSAQEYEGKPELTVYIEDVITLGDCLGSCKLLGPVNMLPFDETYQSLLFSAGTGVETSEDKLFEFARRVRNLERAYNVREGMTRETDSLPKRYMDKPIEQGEFKGQVTMPSNKFEEMKDKYYALRGWDIATGIPTRETLEQTGLKDIARDLEKRGKLPGKSPSVQSKEGKH